jgi:magnesium-transporting ATPase (P-type)
VVESLQILARTSPFHNKFLIEILKEDNRVVAATGSQSDDLEIFEICDVALSFGKMGSDITKS